MLQGQVIRAAGGFFAVRDESGAEYLCRARGALKKNRGTLMVGDRVFFKPDGKDSGDCPGEGIIEKIQPRSNCLYRPPVANIDQLVVVMSLRQPDCDWQLISRLAVLAEKEGLSTLICLNKTDLVSSKELSELQNLLYPYPYRVLLTSAVSGKGLDDLAGNLNGCCSVFAGPSGVGKSSLLNVIQPGLSLQTGSVSDKIKRGRHTTRQAELLILDNGGAVVDTPGFTRLDFRSIDPVEMADYFPEFDACRGKCAFRNCLHLSEPDCAVLMEIDKTVNAMRYEHYRAFMKELEG